MRAVENLLKIAYRVRREFVRTHYDDTLEGFCHYVSLTITREAKKVGIKPRLIFGTFNRWAHTWLEYNGKIIDATATQFGIRNKVLVTDVGDGRYEKWKC